MVREYDPSCSHFTQSRLQLATTSHRSCEVVHYVRSNSISVPAHLVRKPYLKLDNIEMKKNPEIEDCLNESYVIQNIVNESL